MPVFDYAAFTESGARETGQIDSASEAAALDRLSKLGLTVVRLAAAGAGAQNLPWYRRDLRLGNGRLSASVQADVAEQLAVLFAAKLPVLDIVRIIETGADHAAVRTHFGRLRRLIAEGLPLSEAFAQAGNRFSTLFESVLRIGDRSANLAEPLQTLALQMRRAEALRAELRGALIYPAILISAAFLLFLFVALYLAPSLAPLFDSVDRPVPGTLSFLIAAGEFLSANLWWLTPAGATLVVAGLTVARTPANAARIGSLLSRMPAVGPVLRTTALARHARTLELLMRAGRTLPDALRDCANFAPGTLFAPDLRRAAERLVDGGRAWEAFDENQRLPAMFRELFRAGEESNTLAEVLRTLGKTLDERAERQIKAAQRLVTPILTLILGGAVGLLVVSVMSAILSVNDLAF